MEKLRIAAVDFSHIFRAAWHAGEGKALSFAMEATLGKLHEIDQLGYDRIICAIDCPPYDRSTVYPDYKAQREPPPPEYYSLLQDTLDACRKQGYYVWGVEGAEADDVIASMAKRASKDDGDVVVDVWSRDKDLFQLVGWPNVKMFSTRNGEEVTSEVLHESDKIGVWPHQMLDFLTLIGDKSDNIPGLPGCGPKYAAQMLREMTLDEVLQGAEDGVLFKPKSLGERLLDPEVRLRLRQGREMIKLNMDLDLPWEDLETPLEPESNLPTDDEEPCAEPEGPEDPQDENEQDAAYLPATPGPGTTITVAKPQQRLARHGDDGVSLDIGMGGRLTRERLSLMKDLASVFDKGGLYRRKFEGAAGIFSIMELGMELGLTPQVALQNFHMVEGKPSPSAHFLISQAKSHPDCEYFECIEHSDKKCTYVTKKKSYPKELSFTYTFEEAERAGLTKPSKRTGAPSNWVLRPAEMIRKTAGSQAARLWYPDACSGLYSKEELGYLDEEGV